MTENEVEHARSLLNSGTSAQMAGRPDEALELLISAIAMLARLVEAGRTEMEPHLAGGWNNLGHVYDDLGETDAAAEAHEQALAIFQRLVGAGQTALEPDLAGSWSNVGNAYVDLGVFDAATTAHKQALSIRQRLVREGRAGLETDLAASMNNLGLVYQIQGALEVAAQAHEQAMKIRQRLVEVWGAELEPDLAASWTNLGIVYQDQGRLEAAAHAQLQALAIYQRLVIAGRAGHEPDLAGSWNNLGVVYQYQRAHQLAAVAHEHALAIFQRLVDAGRKGLEPDLGASWNNVGVAFQNKGAYEEAATAHQLALKIRERLVEAGRRGLEPDLADSWNNLGNTYRSQGVLAEAAMAHRRALSIRKRLLETGQERLEPDLAGSYNNLGVVYHDRGELEPAADAHANSAALLTRTVTVRGLWQYEQRLADALLAVTAVRTQQGEFAAAEDYLWHAADLVPHLPSVLHAAVRFYGQWLAADDAALVAGGLPRDEVWEGCGAILARLAPHHSYGASARIALAQHRHLLGHQCEARGVFERAVADYGADTPGVYAHFARFLLATGDHAAAWTTCEQGWRSFAVRLEAAGSDPSPLPLDHVSKLVEGLLVLIDAGLTATSGSAELREYPERRTRQLLELSAALKSVHVWTPRLAASVRVLVADAEQAIAQNAVSALSESERRRILGEQLLQSAFGNRWPSVQSRIAALAQDDVDGEGKMRRIAEIEKDLLETLEIQQAEPQWRRQLSALLGADARRVLGSRVFDHLLIALAAPAALEKVGAPAEAAAAIALHQLGAAVEAALEGTVFGPYRAALRDGAAERIEDVGYLAPYFEDGDASALRLGTMTIPWGRLGAHWREPRPAIAALAQWLVGDAGPFDPERVKDPMLYRLPAGEGDLLDRIAALRNRGAHGTGAPAKPEDVVQLERLVLGTWRNGDLAERGFLPRLFGAKRRVTTTHV